MRFLFVLFVLVGTTCFGQAKQFFAQAHLKIEDKSIIKQLQNEISEQPGIWMVRIDDFNGNVLIYTAETPYFTLDEFKALFGSYADKLSCPFIGVVRQDLIRPFPFKDCQ
ncbi:MAG: hypothetical protein ACKO00_00895 [Crocinitomicaceae bacterium]